MQYEHHPSAGLFPMLPDDEYAKLRDDIRQHGQRDEIVLVDGLILDGRNRYRACLEIGVQPFCSELDECDDPVSYVLSKNLHRRHLTPSQKAAIATEALGLLEAEAAKRMAGGQKSGGRGRTKTLGQDCPRVSADSGKAVEHAATIAGVSARYVADAKKLKAESPELFERVKSGEITIPEAKRDLSKRDYKCANCGHNEADEDGACAKCLEPATKRGTASAESRCRAEKKPSNDIGKMLKSFDSHVRHLLAGRPAHFEVALKDHARAWADS